MFGGSVGKDLDKIGLVDGGSVAVISVGHSLVLRWGSEVGIGAINAIGTLQRA